MACKYTYKGNEYTRGQILDQIMKGGLSLQVLNQQKARDEIKRITGMTDAQIEFVKGLIDGKALGRMLSDGNILLSEMSSESTAYHEAFHRVWQGSLTSEERNTAIREFKTNKNWERLIEPYRASYGDDVDVRIEEYFADEFANFVLGEPTPKTFLQKLFAQLKKMLDYLGLTKPSEIERIYDLMNKGAYASRSVERVFKESNSIVVKTEDGDQIRMYQEDFMPVVETLHKITIGGLIEADLLDAIGTSEEIPIDYSVVIKKALSAIEDELEIEELENKEELTEKEEAILDYFYAIEDDLMQKNPKKDSKIFGRYMQYYDELSKTLSYNQTEKKNEDDSDKNLEEGSTSKDKELGDSDEANESTQPDNAQDGARWEQAAFEVDPNSKIRTAIKIILSALENPNDKTRFGLSRNYNWVDMSNFILDGLANTQATEETVFKKLKSLASNRVYGSGVQQLIDILGGESLSETDRTNAKINNRIKFINQYANAKYTMLTSIAEKNDLKVTDASNQSLLQTATEKMSTKFMIAIADKKGISAFYDEMKKLTSNKKAKAISYVDLFNFRSFYDALEDKQKSLFAENIEGIANVVVKNIEESEDQEERKAKIVDLFKSATFTNFGIQGYGKKAATIISESGSIVENSMLTATGGRVHGISLNSYMTQITNEINDAIAQVKELKTTEEKKEKFFQILPQLKSSGAEFSFWLEKLLRENGRIKLSVNEGIKTKDNSLRIELSEAEETTLFFTYINQLLKSETTVYQTPKHSDRSVLYSMQLEFPKEKGGSTTKSLPIISANNKSFKSDFNFHFGRYLYAEAYKLANLPEDIQNLTTVKYEDTLFGSFVDYNNLIKNGRVIDQDSAEFKAELEKLYEAFEKRMELEHKYIDKSGIYEQVDTRPGSKSDFHGKYMPVGINSQLWKNQYKKIQEQNPDISPEKAYDETAKAISKLYVANSTIAYIEQALLITGDPNLYKNGADTFKRLNVFSSTGDLSVHGQLLTDAVLDFENREENYIRIVDSKGNERMRSYSQGRFSKNPNYISINSLAEEDYYLPETTLEQYKQRSKAGFKTALLNMGMSEKEAEKLAEKQSEKLKKAYKKTNWGDGQSYMNLFEWRRTKLAWGQWSEAHDNLFERELRILNGEVDAVYEIPEDESAKIFFEEFLGLAETMKGQYTGPFWSNDQRVGYGAMGVAKTSFFPMLPSQVMGTRLEEINRNAIENGVGVIAFSSARKFGGRIKTEKKEGKTVPLNNNKDYKDGMPRAYVVKKNSKNETVAEVNSSIDHAPTIQFMERRYFKHQVAISNKEKSKVVSATQSYKLNLSNLFNNGVPIDVPVGQWNALKTEAEKRRASKIYDNVSKYSDIMASRIERSIDKLSRDVSFDQESNEYKQIQKLVDKLKDSLQKRGAAKNILDVLDLFAEAEIKAIEMLPNRFRIEPVLYSLVRNEVTVQKRNGTSVPQVSSAFFEPKGKKNQTYYDNKKIYASEELSMYKGENNYAELMLPLPIRWIDNLMEVYGTRDVVKLVETINDDIAHGNFDKIDKEMLFLKGLRIPNQQTSSNDVFFIKKFLMPTNVAMVVVPPAIATKAGSDFDIDKLNMYLPHGKLIDGSFRYLTRENMNQRNQKELFKVEENELLQAEMDLMTQEENFLNLMKPTDDVQWKGEGKMAMEDRANKLNNQDLNPNKKVSIFDVFSPVTNVVKTRENIASKAGVGQVAVSITNHTVNQVYGFKIRLKYMTESGNERSRELPFLPAGDNNFSTIINSEGEFISELLSGLLTSQVDAVKDPYAKVLGLVGDTLNIATYLLQRGVPHMDIINFFAQKSVREYIKQKAILESVPYTVKEMDKKIRRRLLKEYSGLEGVRSMSTAFILAAEPYLKTEKKGKKLVYKPMMPSGPVDQESFRAALEEDNDEWQYYMLKLFQDLTYQSFDHREFMSAVSLDTFKPKKREDVLARMEKIENANGEGGLVENIGEEQKGGPMSGFFSVLKQYNDMYKQFYRFEDFNLYDEVLAIDDIVGRIDYAKKERLVKTINEDFATYLVQSLDFFKEPGRDFRVLTGTDQKKSFAEVIEMLKESKTGERFRVLKSLIPVFNAAKFIEQDVDVIRRSDLGDNLFVLNEYIDELAEMAAMEPNFFNNLLTYTMYAYGFSKNILSLEGIMPVKIQGKAVSKFDLVNQALEKLNSLEKNKNKLDVFLDNFRRRFYLSNPSLLRTFDWSDDIDEDIAEDLGDIAEKLQDGIPQYYKRYDEEYDTFYIGEYRMMGNKLVVDEYLPVSSSKYKIFNGKLESIPKTFPGTYNMISKLDVVKEEGATKEPVQETKSVYSQLGKKTKSENVTIKKWDQLSDQTSAVTKEGVVSTRIKRSKKHFGNPFTSDKTIAEKNPSLILTQSTKESVEKYIDWILSPETTINKEQHKWIREQLQSGELKGKPILYYKELNEPSHATALDYLINKYDWTNEPVQPTTPSVSTSTTAQSTITEQQVDQIFRNNPDLAQVIFKEFDIDYKDMSYNGKNNWVEESVLGDAIMLREELSEAEEGQYPSKKELEEKEEGYRKHYTAIDTAAKQTYIEYVKKEGLNEDIEKLKKFLPTSVAISTYRAEEESRKKCKSK